jgi:hypothetical protein
VFIRMRGVSTTDSAFKLTGEPRIGRREGRK